MKKDKNLRNFRLKLQFTTLIFIIMALGMSFFSYNLGSRMVLKYTPLIDAAMEIKLEATTAHLWFEEIISGDRGEDINGVYRNIDNSIWYAKAMLYGNKNDEGIYLPLNNKDLEREIEQVLNKLKEFKNITKKRYANIKTDRAGSEYDKVYDAIFKDFIEKSDSVETKLQKIISIELESYQSLHYFIAISSVILILLLSLFIWYNQIKRIQSFHLLEESNNKLKFAQQELLQSYKTLTNIAGNVPGVVCTFQAFTDGRSCFPYASDHIYDIYGVTPQEVREDATKANSTIYSEDLEDWTKSVQVSYTELTLWKEEFRVIHPDKGIIWVKGMALPEKQSDGSVLWYGYLNDITKEKTSEVQQQQLLKRLEEAQSIAKLGSWSLDINNNNLTWTDETYRIFGVDKKDPITHERFKTLIHPEDVDHLSKAWENALNGEEYNIEHRIVVDNKIRWINEIVKIEFDKEGKPSRALGIAQDITVKKELEKAKIEELKGKNKLLQVEEKFNRYFQLSLNLQLISTTEGIMQEVNSACKSILGYEKNELIGNQFLDLLHSDDIEPTIAEMSKLSRGEKVYNFENRYIHKDGHYINLLWTSTTDSSNNLIYATAQDITEQVEYREELKSQSILLEHRKKELETIIQENPLPMILHREGGEIIIFNNAWSKSSGFSIEDTPTINDWIELTQEDEEVKASLKKHIDSLYKITETIDEGEFTFFNKNRDIVSWQVFSSPLGLMNGKKTVITSAMDITELKEKERLLVHQSKMASMGEMLGNIAHQWRQPLSIISTAATGAKLQNEMGLLNKNTIDTYFDKINDSAQNLSQIVEDFRTFFNPSNNKEKEFNISETFIKTLKLIKSQFTTKDIKIIQNIEDYELVSIENELVQVLINILNNARDALLTKENQKRLIFINTYKKDNVSYIEILDNAGGIEESIINRIFEPYFTTKHQFQGTGIGLYMSEEIVHKHLNGNLSVSNEIYTYEGVEYIGAKFVIGMAN